MVATVKRALRKCGRRRQTAPHPLSVKHQEAGRFHGPLLESSGPMIARGGLLALVSQSTAGCVGAGNVNGPAALLDICDLAILVYDESRTVGNAHLRNQHAVLLGDLAHVVAEHGIAGVQFRFPMLQGRAEIGTDGDDLGIILIKVCDTRLVRGEFLRSTTGEGGHEESQDHDFFAAEIGELHGLVVGVGQSEVGGFVTDF